MEQTVQKLLQDVQGQLAALEKRKKEFEAQMKHREEEFESHKQRELQTLLADAEKTVAEKLSNIEEREQKLTAQEEFIRDQQLKNSKIIKLNVGGKRFTTTLTTLTADKDSMLAAMFSGRFTLEKDEDGCYFIDRNGKYFSYILDFLRTGSLPAKLTKELLEELAQEASYYQLTSLVNATKRGQGGDKVGESIQEKYITWWNLDNTDLDESKPRGVVFSEITALVKKGYLPIQQIRFERLYHNFMIIFQKQQ